MCIRDSPCNCARRPEPRPILAAPPPAHPKTDPPQAAGPEIPQSHSQRNSAPSENLHASFFQSWLPFDIRAEGVPEH
eukprot:12131521-Alexandrium_andersonii.AAC.1